MAEHGYTASKMAEQLGITLQTFSSKMRRGIFNSDEMFKMVEILKIDDPVAIFFAKEVSEKDTNTH
jgi:DNA-binding XRE family transcriptional regulator